MSEQMFVYGVTIIKDSKTIIINCKNINEDMSTNNFAIEFDKLSKYLMGFAYKLTQDVHQAEDLFQDTALRETMEEIGVEKNRIQILGSLSPLYVFVSNSVALIA